MSRLHTIFIIVRPEKRNSAISLHHTASSEIIQSNTGTGPWEITSGRMILLRLSGTDVSFIVRTPCSRTVSARCLWKQVSGESTPMTRCISTGHIQAVTFQGGIFSRPLIFHMRHRDAISYLRDIRIVSHDQVSGNSNHI